MDPVGLFVLAVLNVPIFYFIWGALFESREDFMRCVKFYMTPDVLSLVRGEYGEDRRSEMRLGLLIVICGVLVVCEYALLSKIFG